MTNLLDIDEGKFSRAFPDRSFSVSHNLTGSPLFQLSRLVELSKQLPESCIEYNLGDLSVSQDPDQTPMNQLSVEDTIKQIESCQSWMVLKYVEQDPVYRELLEACLSEVDLYSKSRVGSMEKPEAFIFITSPGSITPFHFDPEHNFLLQIRGDKTMHTFDRLDRDLVPETSIERFYNKDATPRNLEFHEADQKKAITYNLKPGDGVFVPQNAPHWVKNEDEVSISFSITFRSDQSERLSRLYYINSQLRKFGMSPKPVMASPMRDMFKDNTFRIIRRLKSVVGS